MPEHDLNIESEYYEIRIEGHLSGRRARQFEGMRIELHPNGETVIYGPVADQAALFGLLSRIRDLGTPLISIARVQNQNLQDKEK